jgi:hypothetical protein
MFRTGNNPELCWRSLNILLKRLLCLTAHAFLNLSRHNGVVKIKPYKKRGGLASSYYVHFVVRPGRSQ